MLGEVVYSFAKERDLHFRRPRIGIVSLVRVDNPALAVFRKRHVGFLHERPRTDPVSNPPSRRIVAKCESLKNLDFTSAPELGAKNLAPRRRLPCPRDLLARPAGAPIAQGAMENGEAEMRARNRRIRAHGHVRRAAILAR